MLLLFFEQQLKKLAIIMTANRGAMPDGITVELDEFLLKIMVDLQQGLQILSQFHRFQLRGVGGNPDRQHTRNNALDMLHLFSGFALKFSCRFIQTPVCQQARLGGIQLDCRKLQAEGSPQIPQNFRVVSAHLYDVTSDRAADGPLRPQQRS